MRHFVTEKRILFVVGRSKDVLNKIYSAGRNVVHAKEDSRLLVHLVIYRIRVAVATREAIFPWYSHPFLSDW